MRQGAPVPTDAALKDARSEPDCSQAQPLLAPPGTSATPEPPSPSTEMPAARRHMLSRSQVRQVFVIFFFRELFSYLTIYLVFWPPVC